MTLFPMRLHPGAETLSRLADQSDIEWARSRAGRHVTRCAACGGTIAGLRELGDAARAMPELEAPPTLLKRIEARRARTLVEGAPATLGMLPAAAPAPLGDSRGARGRGTGWRVAVLAAGVVFALAVLASPLWRRHDLAAANLSGASLMPRYPRPGTTVGMRFSPKPGWTGGDTLWAEGSIDLRYDPARNRGAMEVDVSEPLVRGADGVYRGRMALPPDALSGALGVLTEPAPVASRRLVGRITLLTSGSVTDRPSLDAMESAVQNERGFLDGGALADAFAQWAPEHPMRWLVAENRPTNSLAGWLTYFSSKERRFARLTTRLNARPHARAGELAGMAGLAYAIEEPEIAAEWTRRLIREHPESPWSLDLRVEQMHQMELRGAPRDSIAMLLPSLDTLYAGLGGRMGKLYAIRALVGNVGDSATIRRWSLREARAGRFYGTELYRGPALFRDVELRDSVAAAAHDMLARAGIDQGYYSRLDRARAYATLGSVALARGAYREALALTDSARVDPCIWMGQDTRGLALLAVGDTARAMSFLAPFGKNNLFITPDSAKRMFGSHFTPEKWQRAVDSAESARQACRRQAR